MAIERLQNYLEILAGITLERTIDSQSLMFKSQDQHRIPRQIVGDAGQLCWSRAQEQSSAAASEIGEDCKMRLELDPEAHMLTCLQGLD